MYSKSLPVAAVIHLLLPWYLICPRFLIVPLLLNLNVFDRPALPHVLTRTFPVATPNSAVIQSSPCFKKKLFCLTPPISQNKVAASASVFYSFSHLWFSSGVIRLHFLSTILSLSLVIHWFSFTCLTVWSSPQIRNSWSALPVQWVFLNVFDKHLLSSLNSPFLTMFWHVTCRMPGLASPITEANTT